MAKLENIKPTIMVALEKALTEKLVAGQVVRDYSDRVKTEGKLIEIPRLDAITVNDYTGTLSHQEMDGANTQLAIDKAKDFSVKVDAVDEAQAVEGVIEALGEAGMEALAFEIEKDILSQVSMAKKTVTAKVADKDLLAKIRKCGAELTKAKAPRTGRVLFVSPEVGAEIVGLLPTISNGDKALDIAIEGYIGRYAGFDIFESNGVKGADGTSHECLAGYKGAIAMAKQLEKFRIMESADFFGYLVQGIVSYGTKGIETGTQGSGKSDLIVKLTVDTTEALA